MRLGEILLKNNIITKEQLEMALQEQKTTGDRLGSVLIKKGYISETKLIGILSKIFNIPAVDLRNIEIPENVLKLIPAHVCKNRLVVPVFKNGPRLKVAMADPTNIPVIAELEFMTSMKVEPLIASDLAIIDTIKKYYGGGGALAGKGSVAFEAKDYDFDSEEENPSTIFDDFDESEVVDVEDFDRLVSGAVEKVEVVESDEGVAEDITTTEVSAPIVKLVNGILIRAIKMGVSDIHFEPYEKSFRVRYRLDGVLRKAMGLPLQIKNPIISRLKIMANLDIAEKRLPQDGRIKLRMGKGREMDFRVSTAPTLFGEKVVLRLLDKSNLQLDMTKLGFDPEPLEKFKKAIHSPVGIVLVTGPTGSGKTTTLYSALAELNKESENIMTAEDPIEFNFMGINQVQMHEEIGLTFASALRAFLRQDPDIIMVGEIRDFETAQIAIQAALTGHLVLSTLHTNDAPSTITRLMDMGIEPFLISSALKLVLAQRLVRKICPECKEEVKVSPKVLASLGIPEEEIPHIRCYKGRGCTMCSNTGYKGRISLFEVMPITDTIKELILNRVSSAELKGEAIKEGMQTLRMSGINKLKDGVTTVEEVIRVTMED
ncbi:MAG: type IV-A pilus assembly ATPase PilB [Deltaproteobacteria bacterium]|nr:MAG: type IV-A pilus assembly ATPase PilB [Deltaproteobacteria bacterium]